MYRSHCVEFCRVKSTCCTSSIVMARSTSPKCKVVALFIVSVAIRMLVFIIYSSLKLVFVRYFC